jgi:thiamine biosynthesis lipoprotein
MILLLLQVQHYLTQDEALKIAIPGADRYRSVRVTLTADQLRQIRSNLRQPVPTDWTIFVGVKGDAVVGTAAVVEIVGKYQPITFMVGVTSEGTVRDVAVMTYRESIGSEIRQRRVLDQFLGKRADAPLRRSKDLLHISGATMSCDAVALGTKMVLQVAAVARPSLQEEPVVQARMRMGSMLRITAYGDAKAVEAAFAEVERVEQVISNYRPDSELSKFNAAAGKGQQKVSADLAEFLKLCRRWTDATDGAFDPSVGPAVRAWGFFDRKYRVPTDDELARLPKGAWTVDELKVSGMELDPGAIGKGYGVDRAVAILKARGVTSAYVDFGSTSYALGAPPGKKGWEAAIRDPLKTDALLCTIVLKDAALSTSGGYEKYFEADGKRYAHILDPKTLKPAEGCISASVIASDGTSADVLSTAVYVRGIELARKNKAEALFIASDGARTQTDGWR